MTAPAHHAHAVLHCNLNTVDVVRSATFHLAAFGGEPRMRSLSTDSDANPMGISNSSTASVTSFLYDSRGPRAAPALELVGWLRPLTEPTDEAANFAALGYRVSSLAVIRARLDTIGASAVADKRSVRGEVRPALRLTDPDGVVIEVVEIPADDSRRTAVLSHERMRCSDLERTITWYRGLGWEVRARNGSTASLVLPEDPTFSLEFEQNAELSDKPRPANTQGLYRVALAVDDVRAAHASLVAEGVLGDIPEPVPIPMPDVPTGGFTVLFLRDPDDAMVELVERPRNAVRRPTEPR